VSHIHTVLYVVRVTSLARQSVSKSQFRAPVNDKDDRRMSELQCLAQEIHDFLSRALYLLLN